MTLIKSKPNFHIVESHTYGTDYEEFKKDFLNIDMSAKEVRTKHHLSNKVYNEYKDRVCEEVGITRKPSRPHPTLISNAVLHEMSNIVKAKSEGYHIIKKTHGDYHYLGRYPTLEVAKKVRDIFYENDWNPSLKNEMMEKYGVKVDLRKPALEKALKLYPEFEHQYLYSDKKVEEIRKEMGITSGIYRHLLGMIRDNHNIVYRGKRKA